MSYKRKPENIAFSVTVTPDKKKKFENEDSRSVAVLAPFNPYPKVSFENIKLHSTAVREVYLVNPTENALQVELTKLPDDARGYNWSVADFELPKESQAKLIISWTPSEYGSWHDNIKIVNKKTRKLLSEVKLSSTTEEPPKVSKRSYRPKGLPKKQNTSSKQEVVKKSSLVKIKSENKENELTFITKTEKQTHSGACIENKNVIIYESKKSFQNKTFTQIKEDDLDDEHCNKASETCIQSLAFSQNSNRLQVGPSTPCRGTYDVIEPAITSRRSTYSLRNRQLTNIIDVEEEKKEFALFASPGIHNKSLEIAATKLVSQNVKIELSTVDEAKQSEASCSATFTVQPSVTYNVVKDSSPLPSVTFNVLEVPSSPLASIPSHHSPIGNQLLNHNRSERISFGSVVSSEHFYDSLEGRQSLDSLERNLGLEVSKSEDLFVNWDEVYDIDKFSSRASFLPPKDINQTKDTLLQLDEDFGKFNSSIVSSSPLNLQNALSNNLTRTFTPIRSNSANADYLEKSIEKNTESVVRETCLSQNLNEGDSNLSKYSKHLKMINTDLVGKARQVKKHIVWTEEKYSNKEENVKSNETLNDLTEQRTAPEAEQMKHSLSRSYNHLDKQYPDVSNDSEQHLLKWNISPPQNSTMEEVSGGKNIGHLPKIKTPPLQTPVRLTRAKSSLSSLVSNTNISQLKDQRCLQVNTNCKKSFEPSSSKGNNKIDNKKPNHPGTYSEEVFLVPPIKIKRGSLQKTMNGSPPKMRRLSQEVKLKRLSTPSMTRKLPLTSTTVERKQHKAEVTRSLTRSATLLKKRKSLKVADWVPAVRRLKLTSTSSLSEEDVSQSSADLATPDPFLAATTLNPFAKGGLYLNNKWLKEQEVELIQWADRMLRPPNELELDRDQSERSTLHRLNALRATAFSILTSTEVATVLSRVRTAVEKNIISIRSDRQLHADLGLQDKIISLLMSYNPLWLRLCLEAVYQCNIQLKCHSDEAGLRDFIRRYVLNDEYLRQTYSHPTVPHLMLPEFEDEMKKFTVYKFLVIVYLLDLVKRKKVILHDPCLFKKDSKLKSSKEILIDFNKDFVAGAGDITRILRLRGCVVSHCQTYIDEFDFSLTSTKELRDGVRLTRLAEKLVSDNSLCSKLRVPAVSNLQKKFNADVAFSALKKAGYDLPLDVSPKDISDGHNEKTLSFLWHLRGIFQKRAVLLIITLWRKTKQLRADRKNFLKVKSTAIKIQRWYRKIKQAGTLSDEELRKGCEARERFLKLKAVVVRLQRRFRKRKEERDFKNKCQAATMIQNWYRNRKGVFKDRNNFKVMRQAAITIQRALKNYKSKKNGSALEERKHFIMIRAVTIMVQRRFRFIKLAKHQRQHFLAIKAAAIKIQRRFRANRLAKNQRHTFLAIKNAIVTIQRRLKAFLITKHKRQDLIKKETAATVIQKRFRAYKEGKSQRNKFFIIKTAIVKIQRKYRAILLAKQQRQDFLKIKAATISIQRRFKAMKEAKRCREEFIAIKTASVTLQRRFRAYLLAKHQRKHFIEKKRATILAQRRFRANKLVKDQRKQFISIKAAAVAIQRRFRANRQGKTQRKHFLTIKYAVLIIQRRLRGYLLAKHQREDFLAKKTAAITVQRRFRANKQGQNQKKIFMSIKTAAITIQRKFRNKIQLANQQRQRLLKMRSAAIIIQKRYREHRLAKRQRTEFITIKTAIVKIQRRFRNFQLAKRQRHNFLLTKTSAITVQKIFRANREFKMQRKHFLKMKNAAVKIQRRFREFLIAKHQREGFLAKKTAAITIQRRFRENQLANQQRLRFLKMRSAAIIIQKRYREHRLAKRQRTEFTTIKTAVVKIQRRFRNFQLAKRQRHNFLLTKTAAITVQRIFRANREFKMQRKHFLKMKNAAVKIQRRFREFLIAKHQREGFLAKKAAAITIQRKFRDNQLANQQRLRFLKMRSAAIIIQKRYREHRLAKRQRTEFITIKTAVVKIQRRFKNCQLAKRQRHNFLLTKTAAITVQRIFRANREFKTQRKHFLKLKNAAVIIQRRFHAFLLAKHQRQNYLALKAAAVMIQKRFRTNKQAKTQRKEFVSIKTATITIQRRFRSFLLAKQQRQDFLEIKIAAVMIQNIFRANKKAKFCRDRFLALKTATVTIQIRFRALLVTKQQRQDYLELKAVVIKTQRIFRSKKQARMLREEFIAKKTAAVKIQRKFRALQLAKQHRQNFLRMKTAAIMIQREYRRYQLATQQREEFLTIKTAVVKIQRRFRSFRHAKKQRQNFLSTKTTAIAVQRIFRANRETKTQRKYFLKLKNAVVIIQRRLRATLLTNIKRQDFLALKAAAVTIQRRFRVNKLAKSYREHFLAIKTAAVIIQTRFKAFLYAKHQRQEFLIKKTAVLTLQRRFRAYKQAKTQRKKFLALKSATVTIQRRFRALLIAKRQRQEYLSLRSATVTIQRLFRAKKVVNDQRYNFFRLRTAAITVQRKFREKHIARMLSEESFFGRKINAAIRIQAAWRGHLVRKNVTVPQPPNTKPASFEASADNNQPISTRGQRYFKVLSNHIRYSVAEFQNTLFNIDKITLLSANQCEYYVRNGAVKILYTFLENQSNRAYGVHKCVELILSILLNLYRAPVTAEIVWKETKEVNGFYHVFDLMMRFKTEKTSSVFCKACTVIWLFAQDPVKAEEMMNNPKIQEIYKYVVKSMKKSEQPGTSGFKQDNKRSDQSRLATKKPESGARKKSPALRFNWGNYFDDHRAFDDKSFALNSVIEKLGRFLKT